MEWKQNHSRIFAFFQVVMFSERKKRNVLWFRRPSELCLTVQLIFSLILLFNVRYLIAVILWTVFPRLQERAYSENSEIFINVFDICRTIRYRRQTVYAYIQFFMFSFSRYIFMKEIIKMFYFLKIHVYECDVRIIYNILAKIRNFICYVQDICENGCEILHFTPVKRHRTRNNTVFWVRWLRSKSVCSTRRKPRYSVQILKYGFCRLDERLGTEIVRFFFQKNNISIKKQTFFCSRAAYSLTFGGDHVLLYTHG